VELFAQVRSNGRILDNNHTVVGGSDPLEASFRVGLIYQDPTMQDWTVLVQKHPRDLDF
jgi:hypothetical protein